MIMEVVGVQIKWDECHVLELETSAARLNRLASSELILCTDDFRGTDSLLYGGALLKGMATRRTPNPCRRGKITMGSWVHYDSRSPRQLDYLATAVETLKGTCELRRPG